MKKEYFYNEEFKYNILIKIFERYAFNIRSIIIDNTVIAYKEFKKKYVNEKYTYSNIFDKIKTVFINLDERNDRLENTLLELDNINAYNYERFSAIKITEDNKFNYKLIDSTKSWKINDTYIYSASGCKASYLEIFKKYINQEEEYILIIEDDIIFEKDILTHLDSALFSLKKRETEDGLNWDILYLTVNLKNESDAILIDKNLLKITSGLTTTAQLFKTKNIPKIIDIIESSVIEIDNTFNDYFENKYCVYPMCAYQRASYSDINKKMMDYGEFHKKFTYSL